MLLYAVRGKEFNALVAINGESSLVLLLEHLKLVTHSIALVFKAFKDSNILLTRYRIPKPDAEKKFISVLLPSRSPHYLCSTVINTSYAKDRKMGEAAKSFNLQAVYKSGVFKSWPPTEISPQGNPFMRRVDLGAPVIPGLYLRRSTLGDRTSQELIHDGKIDFADC